MRLPSPRLTQLLSSRYEQSLERISTRFQRPLTILPNRMMQSEEDHSTTSISPRTQSTHFFLFPSGSLKLTLLTLESSSTIHFPFSLNYTTSYDSDLSVLKDIATKCGFLGGGSKSDLKVNYKVQTKVKVVAISISPSYALSLPLISFIQRRLSHESEVVQILKFRILCLPIE